MSRNTAYRKQLNQERGEAMRQRPPTIIGPRVQQKSWYELNKPKIYGVIGGIAFGAATYLGVETTKSLGTALLNAKQGVVHTLDTKVEQAEKAQSLSR